MHFPAARSATQFPNVLFIPYYGLKDEREQIKQIEVIPQEELDKMRTFHRACVERYRNGEWR